MRVYLYAIIDSNDKIRKAIKGLEKASVYNIPYRDIGLIVSKLNGQVQDISIDRAIEHEGVVETLMEDFTLLPVRFLTLFDKEEDLLSVIKGYYSDFIENLDRLRNKIEFGIKVIWPGNTIRERIMNNYPKDDYPASISGDSPGKDFIKARFKRYKITKGFEDEAERCIAVIDNLFSLSVTEKRLERLKSENLLLNAYYLVEKERQDDFRRSFEQLKSSFNDFKYLFSGPWPPYNFIIPKVI
ncbi:MAG: GvpL/GvpF family gas vesicle protein [Nitrospinae bacterium]|nr:GvpL/GvpF family gas vesicle protein [Nitrospinota bacterium]